MPVPQNVKQVKQFLGLVGYYRKFVPCFSDIARPLTQLGQKNEGFIWTTECNKCFHMLKDYLQEALILRYPDPAADYILYTDASKYAYAGVLTQSIDGTDHPVAYTSGLFRGSQLNWAALTKEAYAIYMSIKKLSFYLDSAQITLRSDRLLLKKFLEKNTIAKDIEIKLPLTNSRMREFQEQDPLVGGLRKQWSEKKLDRKHFTMEDEILKKKTVINGILYTPTVVPDVLKDCLLILAHDKQGHNGFKRTYSSLKQLYHWKGMKKTIQRHCNACSTCAKHNIKVQQIQNEHFKVLPQPMEFIAMDLIGEFHPPQAKTTGMHSLQYAC